MVCGMTRGVRQGLAVGRWLLRDGTTRLELRAGERLAQLSRMLLLAPFRGEEVAAVGGGGDAPDVLAELAEYTGLSREVVADLCARRTESFRSEWHAAPGPLRADAWFYLSSKMYLFANVVHPANPEVLARLTALCPPGERALEFGGGTGNLAIALAGAGISVDYLERSALQKDFVRFRAGRRGLAPRLRALDWWEPLERSAYRLVCAFDVLEHLSDWPDVVAGQLIPSLAPGGALVEASHFVRNIGNPMHVEDEIGFDRLLEANGLELESDCSPRYRVWRLTGDAAAANGGGG